MVPLSNSRIQFPRVNLRLNASVSWDSNGQAVHSTGRDNGVGRDTVGSWTRARMVGSAGTMNRALVPCPHGPGWAGQLGPHGFQPKLEKKENNLLLKSIKTKR
jgi:hypothetical protein